MYISIEKAMNMILGDGTVFKFKECGSGLYYYDMGSTDVQDSAKNNAMITPYYLLSTVTKNKELYTHVDIEGADRAIRYQGILGWPAISDFKTFVNSNLLLN